MKVTQNWRSFVLNNFSGNGIEIGPLHAPFPYNQNTTKIKYVDRYPYEKLISIYPSLKSKIVKPDIIEISDKLSQVPPDSLDFICNSHLLEHLVNPGRTIEEWVRVVRPNGFVYIVAPDKRFTFDKERELTSVTHLINDFENKVEKVEKAHYRSWLKTKENTKQVQNHYNTQAEIHVHVWDTTVLFQFMKYLEVKLSFKIVDHNAWGQDIVYLLEVQ